MAQAFESSGIAIQNLVERLQAGDVGARRELVGRACSRLRRLAGKMLNSFPRVGRWEEADDVAQNASLRLLRTLEAVTPASAAGFFALAAREIRRELIDLSRRHQGPEGIGANHASGMADAAPADSSAAGWDPSGTEPSPEELERWTEFHVRVEGLPAEDREVFDLLWYHELTQEEAAAALAISLTTLKRRWMAARLSLQAVAQEIPSPS